MSLDATTLAIAVAGMSVCVGGLVISQSCEKPKARVEAPKKKKVEKKSKVVEEKRKSNKKSPKAGKKTAKAEALAADKKAAKKESEEAPKSPKKKSKKAKSVPAPVPVEEPVAASLGRGSKKKNNKKHQSGESKGDGEAAEAANEWDSWEMVPAKTNKRSSKKAVVQAAVPTADAGASTAASVPEVSKEIDLKTKVPAVIGKGGSVIKGITEKSGARLVMTKDSTMCTIRGSRDAVAAAEKMVLDILTGANVPKPLFSISLGNKGASIIGKAGSNIKRIETESGAVLRVESDHGKRESVCHITGEPEQANKAAELVKLYLVNGGPPPEATATLPLGGGRGVTLVIGKGGATIRGLQESTGARLAIARPGTDLVISGTAIAVGAAVAAVKKLLADNDHTDIVDLSAERGLIGAVMGRGGETVQRIQKDTGARLDIKRNGDSSTVVIAGTRDAVCRAKAAVEAIVLSETGPPTIAAGDSLEQVDLGKAVSMVIGRGGDTIRRLQEESGAKILVRTLKSGSVAYIHGNATAVAKAVAEVTGILTKMAEQEKSRAEARAKAAANAEADALFAHNVSKVSDWGDEEELETGEIRELAPAPGFGPAPVADDAPAPSWCDV